MGKHLKLQNQISNLPAKPGVYLYRNSQSEVIYVGKAKNLRKRVQSYFNRDNTVKTQLLVTQIATIEYHITTTEVDALVLEDQLIRKHQPRYNILLKNESSLRYICISRTNPPQITTNRKPLKQQYCFGPFPFSTHQIARIARDLLGLTGYTQLTRDQWRLYLETSQLDEVNYRNFIQKLIKTIKFGDQTLIHEYQQRMHVHAQKSEFEQALRYRHRIELLGKLTQRTASHLAHDQLIHLVVEVNHSSERWLFVFQVKHGLLQLLKKFQFASTHNPLNFLEAFLKQYYQNYQPPRQILVYSPQTLSLDSSINLHLSKIWQTKVIINQISSDHTLLPLAFQNIQAQLKFKTNLDQQLQTLINVQKPIKVVDFVDISNLGEKVMVGGVIRWQSGQPIKKLWRHYLIRTVVGQNDYASITETIKRRYQKIELPDLLVIDGGIGQINATRKALNQIDIPIVGLAKAEETLIFEDGRGLKITPHQLEGKFLIQGRDAVHKFVIEHSQKAFRKLYKRSGLDEIPGIGAATKFKLLKKFQSVDKIYKASFNDLIEVVGKHKAQILQSFFKINS